MTKQLSFEQLPLALCIHMKRFEHPGNSRAGTSTSTRGGIGREQYAWEMYFWRHMHMCTWVFYDVNVFTCTLAIVVLGTSTSTCGGIGREHYAREIYYKLMCMRNVVFSYWMIRAHSHEAFRAPWQSIACAQAQARARVHAMVCSRMHEKSIASACFCERVCI